LNLHGLLSDVPLADGFRGQVITVEAEPDSERSAWLAAVADVATRQGAAVIRLECGFGAGGPWAGVAALLEALLPELELHAEDLVVGHDYELLTVLPLLRRRRRARYANLTDLASPGEQVRFYPADRALRIVHGLVDLVGAWKEKHDPRPWLLICSNMDAAGALGSRFFRELMRRHGPRGGLVLIALSAPTSAVATDEPGALGAAAAALEAAVGEDALLAESRYAELIRLWQASDRPERAVTWQLRAFETYTSRGFYEDALRHGEAVLAYLEQSEGFEETRYWKLVNKLFACYAGSPERSLAVVESALNRIEMPRLRGLVRYLLAMLHARYLPEKNLELAEAQLDLGLVDFQRAGLGESELAFQVSFNRNGLALVRHLQGRYDEAIALCREAHRQLDEKLGSDEHLLHRSVLLYNIGQVYAAIGQREEAIRYYGAAIEADPHYSEYFAERGNLLRKLGRHEEACADLLHAVELSPPFPEVHNGLGKAYRSMDRLAAARAQFERSLDLDPTQIGVLILCAECRELLGDLAGAWGDYTAALALQPEHASLLANRAALSFQMGNAADSLCDLDRAIDLSPDTPDLYLNRAVAQRQLRRPHDAARDLRQYLVLCPDDAAAAQLRAEIAELDGLVAAATGSQAAPAAAVG
jgi:tetratricopeptide (TPR) repeat protein